MFLPSSEIASDLFIRCNVCLYFTLIAVSDNTPAPGVGHCFASVFAECARYVNNRSGAAHEG